MSIPAALLPAALLFLGLLWPAAIADAEDPPAPPPDSTDDQGFVQRTLKPIFDDEDAENGGGGVHLGPFYPSLTVLSAGGSIGPMLELWDADVGGSGLGVQAAGGYSIRRYGFYAARIGRLPRRASGPVSFSTSSDRIWPLPELERLSKVENHLDLYVGYRHRDYPEEDFFGIGFGSSVGDRTDFHLRDDLAEAVAAFHFSPRFALSARAGLLRTSLRSGRDDAFPDLTSRFDDRSAPGLDDPPDEVLLTAGLMADLRDEPGNPHRGALLLAGLSRFDARNRGDFDFTRAAGDLRLYLPLGSPRHVIATRALASIDRPDSGGRVPFYLMSSLGGSQVMRGYPAFRFRDQAIAAVSAEYRFEPISKLELAVFLDAGQAARDESDLRVQSFRTAWGGGIRLKSHRHVLARFDVARSQETTRYLVKLGPSF